MSTTFAIDSNNGFLVEQGQLVFVYNKEAVAVSAKTLTQTLLGEDPFYTEKGMPNFQTIWSQSPNIPEFESSLRTTLLSLPNIINANNFVYNLSENILTYTIDISTEFGITALLGSLNT